MPHELPVFLLPVSVDSLGSDPAATAEDLIADSLDESPNNLWEDTSTYWWRTVLTRELAAAWEVPDLDFLQETTALLDPFEAARAAAAIEQGLKRLCTEAVPALSRSLGPEVDALHAADLNAIRRGARPAWKGGPEGPEAESYISYLLGLAAVARQAADRRQHLLYYAPEP